MMQWAYFPDTASAIILSEAENGTSIEVSLVGSEGVIGIPIVLRSLTLPYRVVVQGAGTAWKMKADVLRKELDRCGPLHGLLLYYVHTLIVQLAQSGAGNQFHTVRQRLCRWLLTAQGLVGSSDLRSTQELVCISRCWGLIHLLLIVALISVVRCGQRSRYSNLRGGASVKATDLLTKQHKEVKALFKKTEKTENAAQRQELLDQIATALKAHTTIEEELLYPAVRDLGTKKATEMVAEALEEHHVVKLVLRELPQVDPGDERFEAKMTVVSELVEHHADEEEEEMFKTAQKLGGDELKELGARMQERSEELAGAPHRKIA